MKIAICDDDLIQLAKVKANMEQYALSHEEQSFHIECFSNPFDLLQNLEINASYDILLLDICMPGILGTDIAKQVREKNGKTEIIFLTSSRDYAVEAFALKAAHYIIKPYTSKQFTEAMDRAVQKLNYKKIEPISIKTQNGCLRFIEISEIMYVESFRHIQTIYFKNGEIIEARETLNKLLDLFETTSKGQFICPYKGFIVNQRSIKGIESDKIILKSGKNIPIVKRNFGTIKQQYFNFMFMKESD